MQLFIWLVLFVWLIFGIVCFFIVTLQTDPKKLKSTSDIWKYMYHYGKWHMIGLVLFAIVFFAFAGALAFSDYLIQ